jgi:hypothetical protein
MNTSQVKKLTLVSYICNGTSFSFFVMARYDEKGRAYIDPDFICHMMSKYGHAGKRIERV